MSEAQVHQDHVAERVRKPCSGRPADLDPGCRVLTVTEGPRWEAAERFVYRVYRDVGYCEPSPRERVEELQRWADRSVFHIVIDGQDEIIGSVRTILGSFAELPIGQFDRLDDSHADPLCELSSLAVKPHSRSSGVIEHLYREGWLRAARSGASALVSVIESWLLGAFTETYGMPFNPIGVGKDYLGGFSIPSALTLTSQMYHEVAELNPEFIRWNSEAAEPDELAAWGFPVILTDEPDADGAPGSVTPELPVPAQMARR